MSLTIKVVREKQANETRVFCTKMSETIWTRPASLQFPTTWSRFSVKKEGVRGGKVDYRIQDITEDMHDEIVELLLQHFIADSPIPKKLELLKDPVAVAYLRNYLKQCISQNVSVVAVVDDDEPGGKPKIVGINVMYVYLKNQKPINRNVDSEKLKLWFSLMDFMFKEFNPYERFNVDKFLRGRMFLVLPEYRRQGIGKELLKAGLNVGKSLGFTFMMTIFTNTSAQKLAAAAGFENVYEINLEEFEVNGQKYLSDMEHKSSKLMVAKII